jgi:hypothetical protein
MAALVGCGDGVAVQDGVGAVAAIAATPRKQPPLPVDAPASARMRECLHCAP